MTEEQEKELDPPEAGQIKMADDGPNKGEHFPDRFPVTTLGHGLGPWRRPAGVLGEESSDDGPEFVVETEVVDDSPAAAQVEEEGAEPPMRDTDDMLSEFLARGEDYERGEDLDATLHNEVVRDYDDFAEEPSAINEGDSGPGWIVVAAAIVSMILITVIHFSMVGTLEDEYAELESAHAELNAEYQGTDTARLNARSSELEEQEARLRGAHTFDGTIISHLDGKVDTAEAELEAAKSELEVAKSELEAMNAELVVARKAVEDARAGSTRVASSASEPLPAPLPTPTTQVDEADGSVQQGVEVVYGSYAQRLVRQRQARLAGRLRGE